MARAAGLGGEQHDEAGVEELGQRVDEQVDQVVVAVAVPDDDAVRAVVEVLVLQLTADDILDREPQVVVDVVVVSELLDDLPGGCLLYTSPSPRDKRQSRMPSSA